MIQLIIIADDFTGGLDTGVQFARKGIRTRVITDPEIDYKKAADGCEVLVVVAETRHLKAFQAYDMVYRIVQKSWAMGVPHLYKKTDSGLRGNIGAELSAVLDASGEKSLAFLPSMPGTGRITVRGVHYVDGVPVSESIFGRDPFEPVTESNVRRLIALQSPIQTINGVVGDLPDQAGILVVDAETEEELHRAGKELAARDQLRVTAGCAGFASALPDLLGLKQADPPGIPHLEAGLFVLCGSVNPITQHQLDYAERHGFARIHIRPEQKLTLGYFESAEGQRALDEWSRANEEAPWLILDANDEDPGNRDSLAFAAAQSLDMEDMRSCISAALGNILPRILKGRTNKNLLITGGDTLLQCMNHMQVTQMEPLLELSPGVVLSRLEINGLIRNVITKSGGFGNETLLMDLKKLIENQNDANEKEEREYAGAL